MVDVATLPDNGIIYDGDYYKGIPYGQYIRQQGVPDKRTSKIFDIRDFGAVADGMTVCTEAVNKAAEAAREAGGGVVLVDGGWYISGTVRIYDNTTLWITGDSALVASKNHGNYVDAFVILDNAKNVRVTGGGSIYGNGEYFVYLPLKKPLLTPLEKIKQPPYLYDPMGYPIDTMRYAIRSRIRYAEDKGAAITTVIAENIPFAIAEFARVSGVTKIVIGRSNTKRYHFWETTGKTITVTVRLWQS